MRSLLFFFIISFVVSCDDSFCISAVMITKEEVKKLEEYVQANIKPVDGSYRGETYDIDGVKYPTDKVEEARKKILPELVKEPECE